MIGSRARNGGVEIAYEVLGDGPPLLLIQGLGYGGRGWGPTLDALAEDFRVVAFDNRGYGASDRPAGPYTVAELAADAVAVLDAAGIERADVVGASLGGMIAQELVLARPERVDRLVLQGATPGGPRAYAMPARTVALFGEAASLGPAVALRRFVENALADDAPGELVDRVVAYRAANLPDPAGWRAQAAAGMGFDAFDRLGRIEAPTLVVHGTEDAVVDVRNAELLAERIPHAALALFPGTGHLFFWEEPERFVRLVTEFLG